MKRYHFELVLAAVLSTVLLLFCHWQAPGSKLSRSEIDACLERIDRLAPLPAEEKQAFIAHLRAWGEADDGQPVYNLNLMRYYPAPRQWPGVTLTTGSAAEANAYYETAITPILIKLGVYPQFGGPVQPVLGGSAPSTNLLGFDKELDNWDLTRLVRYPSRRAFFELVSDPAYLKFMPYKLASLRLVLTPYSGAMVVPDLRFVLGAVLLLLFTTAGWWRAARRAGAQRAAR